MYFKLVYVQTELNISTFPTVQIKAMLRGGKKVCNVAEQLTRTFEVLVWLAPLFTVHSDSEFLKIGTSIIFASRALLWIKW